MFLSNCLLITYRTHPGMMLRLNVLQFSFRICTLTQQNWFIAEAHHVCIVACLKLVHAFTQLVSVHAYIFISCLYFLFYLARNVYDKLLANEL